MIRLNNEDSLYSDSKVKLTTKKKDTLAQNFNNKTIEELIEDDYVPSEAKLSKLVNEIIKYGDETLKIFK